VCRRILTISPPSVTALNGRRDRLELQPSMRKLAPTSAGHRAAAWTGANYRWDWGEGLLRRNWLHATIVPECSRHAGDVFDKPDLLCGGPGMDRPQTSALSPPGGDPSIIRISTEDFPAQSRLEACRDLIGRTMMRLEIECLPNRQYFFDATMRALPDLFVLEG